MSNNNFEGQSDGDWEDRGELSWQEYDWQQYLARHEQEVEKFISLYNGLIAAPERIDEVAVQMGWDEEDWSVSDGADELDDDSDDDDDARDEGPEDFDPYTLLRHPVYVVVRGLYRDLRRRWSAYIIGGETQVGPTGSWALAQVLSEGETHATLSLQSLDMGDYALAVCQMKLALEIINKTFYLFSEVLAEKGPMEEILEADFRVRLFDLREVCLRIMNDCRNQNNRKL
ncbi:MAG: hypothetical protein JW942_10275 [Opitutales bacterium]|nr:hypothetical protein [Opitutales bacterium]